MPFFSLVVALACHLVLGEECQSSGACTTLAIENGPSLLSTGHRGHSRDINYPKNFDEFTQYIGCEYLKTEKENVENKLREFTKFPSKLKSTVKTKSGEIVDEYNRYFKHIRAKINTLTELANGKKKTIQENDDSVGGPAFEVTPTQAPENLTLEVEYPEMEENSWDDEVEWPADFLQIKKTQKVDFTALLKDFAKNALVIFAERFKTNLNAFIGSKIELATASIRSLIGGLCQGFFDLINDVRRQIEFIPNDDPSKVKVEGYLAHIESNLRKLVNFHELINAQIEKGLNQMIQTGFSGLSLVEASFDWDDLKDVGESALNVGTEALAKTACEHTKNEIVMYATRIQDGVKVILDYGDKTLEFTTAQLNKFKKDLLDQIKKLLTPVSQAEKLVKNFR